MPREQEGELTVVNELHQSGRRAHRNACLFALEKLYLLLDLHVFCKLKEGDGHVSCLLRLLSLRALSCSFLVEPWEQAWRQ